MEKTKAPKPGIYKGVPFEAYLAWDAFSYSMAKRILRSPRHLKHYMDEGQHQTDSMRLGSLVDEMVCGLDNWHDKYWVTPDTYTNSRGKESEWTKRSSTCRDIEDAKRAEGYDVVSAYDVSKATAISAAIHSHFSAGKIVADADRQVSMVWVEPDTKVLCKGRIDLLYSDTHGKAMADVKTTKDASPGMFSRTVAQLGYHIQQEMYLDGYAHHNGGIILPYTLIVAETVEPHCVAAYTLGPYARATGHNLYKRACYIYRGVTDNDHWHGYSNVAEEIDIPRYAVDTESED